MPSLTSLIWFRQDLRLADNAALLAAIEAGPTACLYVLDDDTPGEWRIGGAQRWWLHHSLASLALSLDAIGGKLILRRGPAVATAAAVANEIDATSIHANRHYEPWWRAIDADLAKRFPDQGGATKTPRFILHDGDTLVPPEQVRTGSGTPFKVYGPFYRALAMHLPPPEPLPAPERIDPPAIAAKSDRLEDWRLLPTTPDWSTGFSDWHPGEVGAARLVDAFVAHAADYDRRRNLPSETGTSSLSPHLHFGEISPRTVWHACAGLNATTFLKELAWRDFARSVLLGQPDIASHATRAEPRWRSGEQAESDFTAWTRGRTGYPIVDAGMRQLSATGWMHNRVRMITASFLVKHLLIDWRRGAAWYWDRLVDADLGSNSLNWQWTAGTGSDSSPFARIMAPLSQSAKFDAAQYIRKWVPELADLSDADIHDPVFRPADYPAPLIGHREARERAISALALGRAG
ncbi:cryptochrome/photolyase family protein [Sphingomonas sp.]|uniref:cryptochrome/photolyase family protein n=1 Tax=Sphingomonas sp. TaxID=28214 RepID=UPI0037521EB2